MDTRAIKKSFRALADITRLEILRVLSGGELTVSAIAERLSCSQPTTSRHLAILREAGFITDRRDGQCVCYSLNREVVKKCCDSLCDCLKKPEK